MLLHKYVDACRVQIFENRLVCFSRPSQLNDPFEWRPHIPNVLSPQNIGEQLLASRENPPTKEYEEFYAEQKCMAQEAGKSMKDVDDVIKKSMGTFLNNDLLPDYAKNRHQEHDQKLGVFCLTQNSDSFLMWAHYANAHKGFMITFKGDHEFFHQTPREDVSYPQIGSLHPVTYSFLRPSVDGDMLTFEQEFLTKSQDWEYEHEYRIIRMLDEQKCTTPDGKRHLFGLPPSCVTQVVLGCNMDVGDQNRIQKALNQSDWRHVTLCQAKLDPAEFRLHYNSI